MTYLKQLATVQSAIVDTFIRVELAKADIPAFQVMRLETVGDMHSSVIGCLHFRGGSEAVFTRGDNWWQACLAYHPTGSEQAALRERFGDAIFHDGEHSRKSGTDPDPVVTFDYTCHSVEALQGLADFLKQTCGEFDRHIFEPGAILKTYTSFDLSQLLAQSDDDRVELARMEIIALRGWGLMMKNKYDKLRCDLEAWQVACSIIGKDTHDACTISAALRAHTKDMCELHRQLWQRQDSGQSARDDALAELEWWLTNRLDVLQRSGHYKEMRSESKCVEQIRTELLGVFLADFRADARELRHPRRCDPELCRKRMAVLSKRIADLSNRLGLKHAGSHYAELHTRYFQGLSPALRQEVETIFLLSPFATHS